jgi:hypothetical protein
MNESCDRWLGWTSPDQHHLQICESCREQWRAHQMLESLAALPRPDLDPGFALRTRRLAESRLSSEVLSPGGRLFMRLYWLSTAIVVILVLLHVASTARGFSSAMLFVGAMALASLPAVSLLRQRCGLDVIDLLACTTR